MKTIFENDFFKVEIRNINEQTHIWTKDIAKGYEYNSNTIIINSNIKTGLYKGIIQLGLKKQTAVITYDYELLKKELDKLHSIIVGETK